MRHNTQEHVVQFHAQAIEAAHNNDKVVKVIVGEVIGQRVQFYLALADSTVPPCLRQYLR